jgi:IS30 family transposase
MKYQQINLEDRIQIQALSEANAPLTTIGKIVGKDPTSIGREIRRNSVYGKYQAHTGQKLYCARKATHVKRSFDNKKLKRLIILLLKSYWSPEQISGRLKLFRIYISYETIYAWIYAQKELGINYLKYLRINKKRNKRAGSYKKRAENKAKKSIHGRPKEVNESIRIGDFEGDTIEGKKGSGFIATLVDRKSKILVAAKMENKLADTFNKACQYAFSVIDKIFTITFDNGSEMSNFEELEKIIECDIYFADPGCPGQRGLNENTNGLMRQFLPKGSDFKKIKQKYVDRVVFILNNRPRKSLGYKTPMESYLSIEPKTVKTALQL